MKRTTLRIADAIHQALTHAAKDDRRSLNEEIVFAVQDLLRKRARRLQQTRKPKRTIDTL